MRTLLVRESFAYGFTIAFWGSGLLLINEYGLLHAGGIMAYAVGAITGFGVLAVATFGSAVDQIEVDSTPSYVVLAGIHYLSALVPIAMTHFILLAALGKGLSIFLTGATVSIFYNLFATFEEVISEFVLKLERQQWS